MRATPTNDCVIAALFEAAATGDVERVAELLDDPNHGAVGVRAAQWTPRRLAPRLLTHWPGWGAQAGACAIHCAAEAGHSHVVERLLARKAVVDEVTRFGATSLMLAAFGGHGEAVSSLLRASAAVGLTLHHTRDGSSGPAALHLACCAADATAGARCVQLLLDAKACVNGATSAGLTPLHFAVANGHAASCEALVAHGAWVQARDDNGDSPCTLARARRAAGKPAAEECLRALHWLPSVRLLWLAHRPSKREEREEEEAIVEREEAAIVTDLVRGAADPERSLFTFTAAPERTLAPLQRLTHDVLRLIILAIVESHAPPDSV